MTLDECKAIVGDPNRTDEEAAKALFDYSYADDQGDLFTVGRFSEAAERHFLIIPFFKEHRPQLSREELKRLDAAWRLERKEELEKLGFSVATGRIIPR